MEAIAEMLAALFIGVVRLALIPLQLAFGLAFLGIEFLFVWLTEGKEPASDRLRKRRQKRDNRKADGTEPREAREASSTRHVLLKALVVVLVVAGIGIGIAWRDYIRKQRIEAARVQVALVADEMLARLLDDKRADPAEGLLQDEQDPWKRPVELFIDDLAFGTLVVVRSHGPDKQSGTLDDVLAVRTGIAPAKAVAAKLAKRGFEAAKQRLLERLADDQGEQP